MAKRSKRGVHREQPRSAQDADAITARLKRDPASIVARLTARVRRSPEALAAEAAEAERLRAAKEAVEQQKLVWLREEAENERLRQSMARTRSVMNQGNDPHRK